jgi:hypothetical protein
MTEADATDGFERRALSAHLRRSLFARRSITLDPLLTYKIGP